MGWQDAPLVEAKAAWMSAPEVGAPAEKPSFMQSLGREALNSIPVQSLFGAARGLGGIGATVGMQGEEGRKSVENKLVGMGANPDSLSYQGGKLASEVGVTWPIGGVLAKGAAAIPGVANAAPSLINALRTGGMTTGAAPASFLSKAGLADMAIRTGAGAAVGGASAAAVGDDAGTGAMIGGAMPGAFKAAGAMGGAVGNAIKNSFAVSDDVGQLAKRAKELGIDIPADRLANSKPLNAVAASLNYVPFSGRAATEDKMVSQLNKAVSNTFGQDSSNVTMALRKANGELGAKFDQTLKATGLNVDKQFMDDVARVYNTAEGELGSEGLKPIATQINELLAKAETGVIDGQAAYNIKRTLDRIGRSNNPNAFHAIELKGSLMDALNRSLGPEKATVFAQTRQQYGNMLSLEKLAKNGVEGEISAARLANMPNINNKPLQELADIAAQFVKGREGQHGAMQRVAVGGVGATIGMPALPAMATGIGVARGMNSALNSNTLKNLMLNNQSVPKSKLAELLSSPEAQQLMYRLAPISQ